MREIEQMPSKRKVNRNVKINGMPQGYAQQPLTRLEHTNSLNDK